MDYLLLCTHESNRRGFERLFMFCWVREFEALENGSGGADLEKKGQKKNGYGVVTKYSKKGEEETIRQTIRRTT